MAGGVTPGELLAAAQGEAFASARGVPTLPPARSSLSPPGRRQPNERGGVSRKAIAARQLDSYQLAWPALAGAAAGALHRLPLTAATQVQTRSVIYLLEQVTTLDRDLMTDAAANPHMLRAAQLIGAAVEAVTTSQGRVAATELTPGSDAAARQIGGVLLAFTRLRACK